MIEYDNTGVNDEFEMHKTNNHSDFCIEIFSYKVT